MAKWQQAIGFTIAGLAVGTFAVTAGPQKPNPHLLLLAGVIAGPSLYSMGVNYSIQSDKQKK